ncbi:MAG: oxidoreductase [Oleiphilus sp.]|nr:MAG: oxidoreductase [Oleiphilus sp.]
MPKLIKNNAVQENKWQTLPKDAELDAVQEHSLVPLQLFLNNSEMLLSHSGIGVWLDSDEEPESIVPYLDRIQLIAINFPKFVDGRGYSYARILRDRYGFKGEIRAIGDVLHDQLYFMKRCGFDAYAIRDDKDAEAALSGLNDFSENYQCAADEPRPLFRRRA